MKKLFVILFGIVFCGIGVFVLVRSQNLQKRCTQEVVGTVISVDRDESIDSDGYSTYTYYPVIEYQAGDKTVSKKYSVGSGNVNAYRVDDKVDVLYDPDKVEDYIIKGDKSTNLISIIFIIMGAIVAVIGVVKNDF